MDAETDKWNSSTTDENNDIVKRAKNMSAMAFSMYQFTKGEGSLRTTQDLFTQAEYFAEEANRLYKVVRQFSYQVGWFIVADSYFQLKHVFLHLNTGSCRTAQERIARSLGQTSDVRANTSVYC
jgi:hypothetical protein